MSISSIARVEDHAVAGPLLELRSQRIGLKAVT